MLFKIYNNWLKVPVFIFLLLSLVFLTVSGFSFYQFYWTGVFNATFWIYFSVGIASVFLTILFKYLNYRLELYRKCDGLKIGEIDAFVQKCLSDIEKIQNKQLAKEIKYTIYQGKNRLQKYTLAKTLAVEELEKQDKAQQIMQELMADSSVNHLPEKDLTALAYELSTCKFDYQRTETIQKYVVPGKKLNIHQ